MKKDISNEGVIMIVIIALIITIFSIFSFVKDYSKITGFFIGLFPWMSDLGIMYFLIFVIAVTLIAIILAEIIIRRKQHAA